MHVNAKVIWICGLSGAGKSTLARAVVDQLRARGLPVVLFDGDELRRILGTSEENKDNHSRDARLNLAMRYANLCRLVAAQEITVVIATISLFHEVHEWNRTHLPGYFEVYLKVPIEELRRRDPKEIYRRFDAGEITHVAGLDLPVDEPTAANMIVQFRPAQDVWELASSLVIQVLGEEQE